MSISTFDRFQGIWLGSVIGQALANQKGCCAQTKIINFPTQNWLVEREKIAQIVLTTENLSAKDIGQQLAILQNATSKDDRQAECGSSLLFLLSLIIFYGANLNFLSKIIAQYNLKSANSQKNAEIRIDILIWSCLLTTVLNNKFKPDINVKSIIRRTTNIAEVEKTLLIEMLEIVTEAAKSGTSLHQLTEELPSRGNSWQKAIALSWYCFTTTPNDFRLSIQRTASLEPNIAWLTAALTGTLSGAYNGISLIPWRWRAIANQNSIYRLESQIAIKLFESWLGVYSINSNCKLFNQQLYAVASPQIIQPRKALRIISQKSFLD
ncbi:MAG TPA: ADP-ribosylglycohydrolase family protein [Coleofasciculaceae cyanobacterium]